MKLISELRRRNVLRMAVLYLGAAWLLMQVADLLINQGVLPDSLGRPMLIVLAIGFPIALLLSWFYEVTPEGIVTDEGAAGREGFPPASGRALDFLVIAVLAAAVLLFAYDKWYPDEPPARSIAVLPFVNMSADEQAGYLCTGVAETILNMLAQSPELHVASRTSSFQPRLDGLGVTEIASLLGVATILEGSVQRQGNRLRITAQLIDAENDSHLWSRNFDRDGADVFAIQDEIAGAVTSALEIVVRDDIKQRIDLEGTGNAEAYEEYMQAEALAEAGNGQEAVKHVERAIALDPEYARAYVLLGYLYGWLDTWPEMRLKEKQVRGQAAARKAIELAPDMPAALVLLAHYTEDQEVTGQLLQRAYENGPNDVEAILAYANYLVSDPEPAKSEELARKALALDPLAEQTYGILAQLEGAQGRLDKALEIVDLWKEKIPESIRARAAESFGHWLRGDYRSSIPPLLEGLELNPDANGLKINIGVTYLLAGMPEESRQWMESAAGPRPSQILFARFSRTQMDVFLQRNDDEVFSESRQLLVDGMRGNWQYGALTWFVEYGTRLGRLDEVLATLEKLYPHLFADPPYDLEKDPNALYGAGFALLQHGDFARGEPLMRAYLAHQDKQDAVYYVFPWSISGRLALGEREAALEKFREFAAAKWIHAGVTPQTLFRYSSLYDPIRDEPEFIALLEVYEQNAAEQRRLLQEADFPIPGE